MIEFGGRPECIHVMAFHAGFRQSVLMVIIMTGNTLLIETKKRIASLSEFRILNVFGFMATPAVNRSMLSFKRITGEVMFKFRLIQTNHLEFPSVVFTMTFEAILFCYRWISMVPFPLGYTCPDFFMTIKAFTIRNLFTKIVAQGAIAHTLIFSMRPG